MKRVCVEGVGYVVGVRHPSSLAPIPGLASLKGGGTSTLYRGTSLTRNTPQDHHRSLGTGLLYGPTGGLFLMTEVPL